MRKVAFPSRRRRPSQDSRRGGPSDAASNVDSTVMPSWLPCERHAGWLVMPRARCGRCAEGKSRGSLRPRRERRSFEASASPPSLMPARRREEPPKNRLDPAFRGEAPRVLGAAVKELMESKGFAVNTVADHRRRRRNAPTCRHPRAPDPRVSTSGLSWTDGILGTHRSKGADPPDRGPLGVPCRSSAVGKQPVVALGRVLLHPRRAPPISTRCTGQ